MDPIGTDISQVTIWKDLLMQAATNSIPSLNDSDFEAILNENICTSKASETSTDYTNMWF
jgi:hypothetical protein